MSEWLVEVIMGVAGGALVWCAFFYWETIKGIHRARCDRVERELRDRLGEGLYFLVPARDENG